MSAEAEGAKAPIAAASAAAVANGALVSIAASWLWGSGPESHRDHEAHTGTIWRDCASRMETPRQEKSRAPPCQDLAAASRPDITSAHGRDGHLHPPGPSGRRGRHRRGPRRGMARRLSRRHSWPRTRTDDRAPRAVLVADGDLAAHAASRPRTRRFVVGYVSYGRNRVPALGYGGEIFELYLSPALPGMRVWPADVRGRAQGP